MTAEFNNLERPLHPIPEYVMEAIAIRGLQNTFDARPAYQQNDYVGWITRAKRTETREKRLAQMLDELETGGIYMGMDHPKSRR